MSRKTDEELLAEAQALDLAYAESEAWHAARAKTILIRGGNAYRLASDDTLETAPVNADGSVGDEWGQVAFDLIGDNEKALCHIIADALESLSWWTEDESELLRKAALSRGEP